MYISLPGSPSEMIVCPAAKESDPSDLTVKEVFAP
jgi:hypothetical protein